MEQLKRFTRSSIFFVMVTIILISAILAGYMWHYYEETTKEMEYIKEQMEALQERVELTARYVAIGPITLTFSPYQERMEVKGTAITFLLGFVGIKNLRNVVARPIVVTISFRPKIEAPEYGTVRYDYTPAISLEIAPPELDEFMVPWGAFPIELSDFKKGDVIRWLMTIEAKVIWMDNEVTKVALDVVYTLTVVGW